MSAPPPGTGPITPDLAGLRRLERRIARSLSFRAAGRRVWESLPAIVQITAAALSSYAIAHLALGHPMPILAVTVTITSLGFNRDARPVRVLRSVFAILLGVALATGVLVIAGSGVWQLALVLGVVLVVSRLLVRDLVFPVAAATPAALTILLGASDGSAWLRVLDACIGAGIALVATALIPRLPGRAAARDARAATSALLEAIHALGDALRVGSPAAAELSTRRLARVPQLAESWAQSLATDLAVSRISPFLRRRLPELERRQRLQTGVSAAQRHLELIARRVGSLVRDGVPRAGLAGLVDGVEQGLRLLIEEQHDLELTGAARSVLGDLGARLAPAAVMPDAGPAETTVVLQLRPLVVDLLVASGLPLEEAQARLGEL